MKKAKTSTTKTVLVRSSTGVFYGALESYASGEAVLTDARRLWYWAGAASLSQLAMEGTTRPKDCKFPCKVSRVVIPNVMEMIDVADAALASLDAVPVWSVK